MGKVNLDALIPREDFEIQENNIPGKKKESISIEDIKPNSYFFLNLRKPDFQRETNEWDSRKICELIKSFVEGDLIPAIILWRSTGGYLFIIDGSHRLSALYAWVNNDYGDGEKSKLFYDGVIPDEQIKIAEETRKLVNKTVGSYSDFELARTRPDKVKPEIVNYLKNLGVLAIQLQWVEGDASKAEESFFKINQQAAPIDKTELKLLKARKKPNSIAARAIIRSGKGHKYWSSFENEIQQEIQTIAEEIHKILFEPKLQTPIKTSDVPVCGKVYSAQTLTMILDFVNIVNKIDFNNKGLDDDTTGEATFKFLKKVRKIAYQLNSNHPSSLGLHPMIYFYSNDGRYRTVSFFAVVDLVMRLEQNKKINDFIEVRESFEKFLIEYDFLTKQIYEKHRDNQKSYKNLSMLFDEIINGLNNDKEIRPIIEFIVLNNKSFQYLNVHQNTSQQVTSSAKDFNTNKKSAIYINEVLPGIPKCKICNGFIHRNSISIDHKQRKQDGGLGSLDNGQITHLYCNTTYKN
ncbi:MAG: GmrSD restriction endonuclease domain-containing protein [Limnoraphis robusta]|jgi:hypothetical protein